MRKEFVRAASRLAVLKLCPWAAITIKVEGGYMAFESVTDGRTWQRQR